MSDRVFVVAAGMTVFGKSSARTLKNLAGEAVDEALRGGLVGQDSIGAVVVANCLAGPTYGQHMLLGQTILHQSGLTAIPVFNIENACASGASALSVGRSFIRSGEHDVVLVVGVEKMTGTSASALELLCGAMDVDELQEFVRDPAPGERSVFMDLYAKKARHYMALSGARVEDFATIAVKNSRFGALNPLAQYGSIRSVEEILQSRVIVPPLTKYMCSPVSDGAAAVVLGSEAIARRLGHVAVELGACAVSSSSSGSGADAVSQAASRAYNEAGLGPLDLDHAELHDAAAPAEIELYETLGFAEAGDGPKLVREGFTTQGGRLPTNTSGGLLSRGHPIGASGLAQICESFFQIRGEAGARQVANVRTSLCQSVGGWIGGDNGAAVVSILQRVDW